MSAVPRAAPVRRKPYIIFTRLDSGARNRVAPWIALRAHLLGEHSPDHLHEQLDPETLRPEPLRPKPLRSAPQDLTQLGAEPLDVAEGALTSVIVWRLFTAQHRQLGAGARLFATIEQARADAIAVSQAYRSLITCRSSDPAGSRFGWVLCDTAGPALIPVTFFTSGYVRNKHLEAALAALSAVEVARSLDVFVAGHLETRHAFPPVSDSSPPLPV